MAPGLAYRASDRRWGMYQLLITLDYELALHRGPNVMGQMISPTRMLLDACESAGAKLTIMAEIGEMWAMSQPENAEFSNHQRIDTVAEIESQLQDAVQRGHDVQLHLHPQWIGARWTDQGWQLNLANYRLTSFDAAEMVDVLRRGKAYLEELLRPQDGDYTCIGFRAGNWVTDPSPKYLRALRDAGLESDTSVFKWGHIDTASVFLDYRDAHSRLRPWYASWDDINEAGTADGILEFPICTERSTLLGMASVKRLRLATRYVIEDRMNARGVEQATGFEPEVKQSFRNQIRRLFDTYPKKLDFCKLGHRHMLRMLARVDQEVARDPTGNAIPIVLIGHSNESPSGENLVAFLEGTRRRFGESIHFTSYRQAIRDYKATAE